MATRVIINNETGQCVQEEYIPTPILKEERIKEIKAELTELDSTINRATEDLYVLTNTIPYQTIQATINKKTELRQELKCLEVN